MLRQLPYWKRYDLGLSLDSGSVLGFRLRLTPLALLFGSFELFVARGVRVLVNAFEKTQCHVSVDLGRAEFLVTEERLQAAQVCSVF